METNDCTSYVYDDDFEPKSCEQIFDESFYSYFELLGERIRRLQELKQNTIDYKTYTDICLIMLRALLYESPKNKKNFTLQNYLKLHSRPDLIKRVDDYLEQPLNKLMTLREAIKTSVDKFIAHYDTIFEIIDEEKEVSIENIFKRELFLMDIKREDYNFTPLKIYEFVQRIVEDVERQDDRSSNTLA